MSAPREVRTRSLIVFLGLWIIILAIGGFVLSFAVNNDPFVTTQYHYHVTLPILFYASGEGLLIPSGVAWVTLSTTNTIGHMFIAGTEIEMNGTFVAGNETNPFAFKHLPVYELTFENALAWNYPIHIKTPQRNFTFDYPTTITFYNLAGSNVYTSPCCTPIYFPTEGNFRPILLIENNDTGRITQVPQNVTSVFVSVQPQSVYVTDGYNRVNEALTYALVFFGGVEMANLSRMFYRRALPRPRPNPQTDTDTDA